MNTKANRIQRVVIIFLSIVVLSALVGILLQGQGEYIGEGIKVEVIERGEGAALEEGDAAVIDYIAYFQDGTEFDRQSSFVFKIGDGTVLEAWSEGVLGMKVGEIRRLTVESESAYGERGIPGVVQPNSRVIFEIKLVEIESSNR